MAYIDQPTNAHTQLLTLGGYRHYNPATGSFVKQDSYSVFKNKMLYNGYQYTNGNPVLLQDQNGHQAIDANSMFIGGSIVTGALIIAGAIVYKTRSQPIPTIENNRNMVAQPTRLPIPQRGIGRTIWPEPRLTMAPGLGSISTASTNASLGGPPASAGWNRRYLFSFDTLPPSSAPISMARNLASAADSQGAPPFDIIEQGGVMPGQYYLTHGETPHYVLDTPAIRSFIRHHGCPQCREAPQLRNWVRVRFNEARQVHEISDMPMEDTPQQPASAPAQLTSLNPTDEAIESAAQSLPW